MTSPHSLLGVLRRQHAHIEALVSRVFDVGGTERRDAVVDLLRYVALHESAEQTFMHPVGLRSAGDAAAIQGRVAEEREIEAVITNLEGLDPESVDFLIYFGLLEEALRGHTRAEEEVEVHVLGEAVEKDEIDRIAHYLALVDQWMDPATRSIRGSVAQLPWTAGQRPGVRFGVRFGELRRKSLQAFEAVDRTR